MVPFSWSFRFLLAVAGIITATAATFGLHGDSRQGGGGGIQRIPCSLYCSSDQKREDFSWSHFCLHLVCSRVWTAVESRLSGPRGSKTKKLTAGLLVLLDVVSSLSPLLLFSESLDSCSMHSVQVFSCTYSVGGQAKLCINSFVLVKNFWSLGFAGNVKMDNL